MSRYSYSPLSLPAAKARLAGRTGQIVDRLLLIGIILFTAAAALLLVTGHRQGLTPAGVVVMLLTGYIWLEHDLRNLRQAPIGSTNRLDQLLPETLLARFRAPTSPADLWNLLKDTYDARFLALRFNLPEGQITAALANWSCDLDVIWDDAAAIAGELGQKYLTGATVLAALFHQCPALDGLLTAAKLEQADLREGVLWLDRLDAYSHRKKPVYGGIARDWAAGFTPMLAQFGTNLSRQVEYGGKNFNLMERTTQLDDLVTGLNSASGNVALIGELGSGKSALLLGLADRILAGEASGSLSHYQIFALHASIILSAGEQYIENTVMSLINEAINARNTVLALDDAQLFFGQGTGAVNLSQVLLPVLQSRSIKLVLAFTPGDWQKLHGTNAALVSLMTPLVLSEPSEQDVMRMLADRALLQETPNIVTTYEALREAYRLSGRYLQDEAYPGRALKLLESSLNHPDGSFISERSVQQTIESEFGVKVHEASAAESDTLLHLEDHIHERMINQTRAVGVVASALRRARAGVSNPKRPIGSFLFLGPTGVGKTELAKSVAAEYFGDEQNIIRLDMSEYQQVADVDRILEPASSNPDGLLPRVRQAPFSVVLFDEVEKAHPHILDLFLQLLDEGNLTDTDSKPASFKDAIIIATSNAGADEIRKHIEAGEQLESFEKEFFDNLISSGVYRPEFLNRFDEMVLFRPLNESELAQVVKLMVGEVNRNLAPKKVSVELEDDAVAELVKTGYDPRLGARPMRRMVTRRVEDAIANLLLEGRAKPGSVVRMAAADLAPADETGSTPEQPAETPAPDATESETPS